MVTSRWLLFSFMIFIAGCSDPEKNIQTITIEKPAMFSSHPVKLINIIDKVNDKDSLKTRFSGYAITSNINVEKVETSGTAEYFTTYLGEIKDSINNCKYHVISQFYTIQAAIIKHGHSNIIFLNDQKKTEKIYSVNKELLPVKLHNNQLYFKPGDKELTVQIIPPLPLLICIPDNGCFESIF